MASDLFNQMNQGGGFNPNQFMQSLNELKSKGGDPNQMIQQMLNSGKITQNQLNAAVNRAQQIMKMFAKIARKETNYGTYRWKRI